MLDMLHWVWVGMLGLNGKSINHPGLPKVVEYPQHSPLLLEVVLFGRIK
jgi:hypothetical protein